MTQEYKLPLIAVALLLLLTGVYLFARNRSSRPSPQGGVARHSVKTPSDEVLKYWTADKKSGARPAPLPQVDTVEQTKNQPRRHPEAR